jgi:hypothetical protein
MTPTSLRMALPCPGKSVFLKSRQFVMKSLQPAWASFDKQGSMKINPDRNPVRFPHGVCGAFCYKRSRENLREREREPGRKVVEILPQPGGRNSGKNGNRTLFEKRTMKAKPHEKINGKIILSRIRGNANEIAWKCKNERNAILSSFLVNARPPTWKI